MEKKVETLAELKGEEVRLRNALESRGNGVLAGTGMRETKKAYWKTRARVEIIESVLLWTIVSLMLIIAGCQTLKGATGDGAWMLQKLSDNVQTEK